MSEIFPGRWTARLAAERGSRTGDDPDTGGNPHPTETPHPAGHPVPGQPGIVLFLIGMRVNKWWRIDQYLWVFLAMGRMLNHLASHPEHGMIRARNWLGRTTMQVGYWRSLDDLVAFAMDDGAPHAPVWRRYYRKASASGAVGVWHETYFVSPGSFETIYANMPLFGLAEATEHVKVDRHTSSSRQRVAHAHARA